MLRTTTPPHPTPGRERPGRAHLLLPLRGPHGRGERPRAAGGAHRRAAGAQGAGRGGAAGREGRDCARRHVGEAPRRLPPGGCASRPTAPLTLHTPADPRLPGAHPSGVPRPQPGARRRRRSRRRGRRRVPRLCACGLPAARGAARAPAVPPRPLRACRLGGWLGWLLCEHLTAGWVGRVGMHGAHRSSLLVSTKPRPCPQPPSPCRICFTP